jgi:hypothetical protein
MRQILCCGSQVCTKTSHNVGKRLREIARRWLSSGSVLLKCNIDEEWSWLCQFTVRLAQKCQATLISNSCISSRCTRSNSNTTTRHPESGCDSLASRVLGTPWTVQSRRVRLAKTPERTRVTGLRDLRLQFSIVEVLICVVRSSALSNL